MNILHVFGKMDRGGAELRTLDIMRNIDRTEFKFLYISLSGKKGALDELIYSLGGKVIYPKYKIFQMGFFGEFIEILRKYNIDIVHSHISFVSGYIAFIAAIARVKTRIVHFRSAGNQNITAVKKLRNIILRLFILTFADEIVAVNQYTKINTWGGLWDFLKPCRIINNGIEQYEYMPDSKLRLIDELGINDGKKIIIHIGRADEPKNHSKIVDIFEVYNNKYGDAKLILVGKMDTPIGLKIKDEIINRNLQDDILIIGVSDNVPLLLSISDVLIFPSLWEGLPGAVLEASAAGLPVVASDIGCHIELKKYFDSIYIVPLTENSEIWADRLNLAMSLSDKAVIRSQFGKSPYGIDTCLDNFRELYRVKGNSGYETVK